MYETELMRKILTSEMAMKMVQSVSPRYGRAYTMLWLFQAIGIETDEVKEWVESLRLQVVPQTATWALPWWESRYGIVTDNSWSIERRRQNVVNRMRSRGPLNPYKMERIISVAAGVDARIVENTGKNHFTVYLSGTPDIVKEEAVIKAIKPVKPARLLFDIVYETAVTGAVYTGGIIRYTKKVTLEQN